MQWGIQFTISAFDLAFQSPSWIWQRAEGSLELVGGPTQRLGIAAADGLPDGQQLRRVTIAEQVDQLLNQVLVAIHDGERFSSIENRSHTDLIVLHQLLHRRNSIGTLVPSRRNLLRPIRSTAAIAPPGHMKVLVAEDNPRSEERRVGKE